MKLEEATIIESAIADTIEQLEENAMRCIKSGDNKQSQVYMDYAEGARMVRDNIEFVLRK